LRTGALAGGAGAGWTPAAAAAPISDPTQATNTKRADLLPQIEVIACAPSGFSG
jgi:hypothetical protein